MCGQKWIRTQSEQCICEITTTEKPNQVFKKQANKRKKTTTEVILPNRLVKIALTMTKRLPSLEMKKGITMTRSVKLGLTEVIN